MLVMIVACAKVVSLTCVLLAPTIDPMPISSSFQRLQAPETGRLAVQLTRGNGSAYPLYFFIPSITRDRKYLIHHWAAETVTITRSGALRPTETTSNHDSATLRSLLVPISRT